MGKTGCNELCHNARQVKCILQLMYGLEDPGICCLANSFIFLLWDILKCMRQQKAGHVLIVLLRIEHTGTAPRALLYTGCMWIMQCSIQSQMWLFLFDISYFRPQMHSITRRTDDDV